MGQYFKAVNTDKQEYICPWCIGGGAKLWEWAVNPQGSIFVWLLQKNPAQHDGQKLAGRWAGDAVSLVGDYDESNLYERARRYRNISGPLVEEWNQFTGLDAYRLAYDPCECCLSA